MRYLAYVTVRDRTRSGHGSEHECSHWFDSDERVGSGGLVADCVNSYRRRYGQALDVRVEKVLTESEAVE